MRMIIKRTISMILVISIVFSFTACGAVDAVREKASTITDSVVEKTGDIIGSVKDTSADAYDQIKKKAIELYGTAKDSAIYVYEEASDLSSAGYSFASAKATELIGNAESFIAGLYDSDESVREIEPDIQFNQDFVVKDAFEGIQPNLDELRTVTENDVEQFVAYYISSILVA